MMTVDNHELNPDDVLCQGLVLLSTATKMKSKVEKIHNKQLQKSRNTWEQKRICRPLVFQILPFVWHQKIVHTV